MTVIKLTRTRQIDGRPHSTPVYLVAEHIIYFAANSNGTTYLELRDRQGLSVEESPEKMVDMIS